jgi:hypothetical protein
VICHFQRLLEACKMIDIMYIHMTTFAAFAKNYFEPTADDEGIINLELLPVYC